MQTIIPHLAVDNGAAAIEFYKKALGATENMRMQMPASTRLMHAELQIGEAKFFLADVTPDQPGGCRAPAQLGGTSVTLHLTSPDVDKAIATAVAAGASVTMPATDMFWGDRYGQILDPFGHRWSIATPKEKLTPEQMKAREAEAFANWGKK